MFPALFKCTFVDDNKNKVETAGKVVVAKEEVVYFSIKCPSPEYIKKKTKFTVRPVKSLQLSVVV